VTLLLVPANALIQFGSGKDSRGWHQLIREGGKRWQMSPRSSLLLLASEKQQHDQSPSAPPLNDEKYLDNLRPPELNLSRESILFGENPSTKKNNSVLRLWRQMKATLPKIVTGAWNDNCGEDNPAGALYNLAFVRLPVIGAFLVYVKNNATGHPLIVDIGNGPFEMSPVAVIGVLVLMLGPVLVESE